MNLIEISGLTKVFYIGNIRRRKITALEDISFEVKEGDVFGYIGHNGAGKTTTFKILTGLIMPTSGSVKVFGVHPNDIRYKAQIGFLPEHPYFYNYLTPLEFLGFIASLFGIPKAKANIVIENVLKTVGIWNERKIPLKHFSKGMLQRLGIAHAIINDPKLLILDEPMSGLDPIGRKDIRDIIWRMKQEGKTIIFSSHILSDVEMICNKVVMLINGRIKHIGNVHDILYSKIDGIEIIIDGIDSERLPMFDTYNPNNPIKIISNNNRHIVNLKDDEQLLYILHTVYKAKGKIISINYHKKTLESLFVETLSQE